MTLGLHLYDAAALDRLSLSTLWLGRLLGSSLILLGSSLILLGSSCEAPAPAPEHKPEPGSQELSLPEPGPKLAAPSARAQILGSTGETGETGESGAPVNDEDEETGEETGVLDTLPAQESELMKDLPKDLPDTPPAKDIAAQAATKAGSDPKRKQLDDQEMLKLLDQDDLNQDEFEKAFAKDKKKGVSLPGAPQ